MMWPEVTQDAKPVADFLRAIQTMDTAGARQLIGSIDPNACDFAYPNVWKLVRPKCEGSRLLHEAVLCSCQNNFNGNSLEIIDLLLDAGADPNHLTVTGYSALHNAAIVNHAPACRRLIAYGAHVNQQSLAGYTALQVSSLYRSTDSTAVLIGHGASLDIINHHGEDALAYATRLKHIEALSMMQAIRAREQALAALQEINGELDQDGQAASSGACEHLAGAPMFYEAPRRQFNPQQKRRP